MHKVLITGGSGFLGQSIGRRFLAQGWSVFSVDRVHATSMGQVVVVDMSVDSPEFADFVEVTQPDFLVHAAGTASVPFSIQHPEEDYVLNVNLTAAMLNAVKMKSPECKVILLSSAAVYGNPIKLPISEEEELKPISPYGRHKLLAEKLVGEFHQVHNIACCSVRIFSAYGPGLRKQILWDICQKASFEKEVRLMGTGSETRDFIHASDIADALLLICNGAAFNGEAINLGSGRQQNIRSIAEELLKCLSIQKPLIFSGENRPGDPLYWQANITRIKDLGFYSQMSIKGGIAEYAKWYLQNNES